jgi:hypothetical protein
VLKNRVTKRIAATGILSLGAATYVLMADSVCNNQEKDFCQNGCSSNNLGDYTACGVDNNNNFWCYCTDPPGPFGPFPAS